MSVNSRSHLDKRALDPTASWVIPLVIIPSWLISVALHALLLLALTAGLKGCEGPDAAGKGELREVGIYVKQPGEFDEAAEQAVDPADSQSPASALSAAESISKPDLIDDKPPVPVETPDQTQPPMVLGPGSLAPSSAGRLPRPGEIVRPSGALGPRHPAGLQKGETTFFGIRDNASTFVYVLDRSGSMAGPPLRAAKAELMASIEGLDATQRFQVIFYNDKTPLLLYLRSTGEDELYWATSINKTLARQAIAATVSSGGTRHMPALRKALSMNPEVIFYLTDADEPRLESKDLDTIKRLNQGRTRIHCVKFGRGKELRRENFLRQLARENGGTYSYRNVSEFK